MSDEAKAVEELARLGQRTLETADKAGGWAANIFGDGFRHLGGTFADSMAGVRLRNRIKVLQKSQAAIEQAGLVGSIRPLTERLSLPLLEAISDESDEGLQDVWAAYVRNAVDPSKPNGDRLLVDVIRRLEPADLPVLQRLFVAGDETLEATDFSRSEVDLIESIDRLSALNLFDFDDERTVYLVAETAGIVLTVHCGDGRYYATKLLRRLGAAVL